MTEKPLTPLIEMGKSGLGVVGRLQEDGGAVYSGGRGFSLLLLRIRHP